MLKEYLRLEEKHYGKDVDMGRVKYVGGKFLKGFKGASRMRGEFVRLKTIMEMEGFVGTVKKMLNS